MRWLLSLLVLLAATIVGCGSATDSPVGSPATLPQAPESTGSTASPPQPPESTGSSGGPVERQRGPTPRLLAGSPAAVILKTGGVDEAFVEVIDSLDGIEWLSLVAVGQAHLTESNDASGRPVDVPPAGFKIQLEVRGYDDPDDVAEFAPELIDILRRVEPDEVLLSESSAALRRLGPGASITFDNGAVQRVAAVVPDAVIGTSELVVVGPGGLERIGAGSSARRVAFVGYLGTGPELEAALLAANGDRGVRVFGGRGNGQGDRQRTTLPAIRVKEIFGEFAFRPRMGSAIEIDPAWIEANVVTVDLPLLGRAKCHRIFAEVLTDVLQGLVDDGLAEVIDPGAFQGCWNPRRISGSTRLSKHSWGMAADINFGNPLDGGSGSPVHPELLDRLLESDVISGHLWSASPDPGHFEYRGP